MLEMLLTASAYKNPAIPNDLPGPATLIQGTSVYGLYGVATSSEFISTATLRTLTGMSSTGTLLTAAPDWLKYSFNGNTIYMPMKALVYNISWNQLDALGLVYGKNIQIGDRIYKVRLIKGAEKDPTSASQAVPPPTAEWNKLMFPVHQSHPAGAPAWASYTNAQLGVGQADNGGIAATICQEGNTGNATWITHRGYNSVDHYDVIARSSAIGALVWRPILEYLGKVGEV